MPSKREIETRLAELEDEHGDLASVSDDDLLMANLRGTYRDAPGIGDGVTTEDVEAEWRRRYGATEDDVDHDGGGGDAPEELDGLKAHEVMGDGDDESANADRETERGSGR